MNTNETSHRKADHMSKDDGTTGKPSKPVRLPWQEAPHVDPVAATESALNAAQRPRVDPKSAAVAAYVKTPFNDEIARVRNATSGHAGGKGRNNVLFAAATNLYELVAAGALEESTVEDALRDAMRDNNYETDKGVGPINATLKSARRRGFDNPRDLSDVGKKRNGNVYTGEPVDPPPTQLQDFQNKERGFWMERDSLRTIYLAALARMCPPWAVLGHCAARALTLVRPNTVLPPIIGGPGSLNWFCAIAATSGGGKSTSEAVAHELVTPLVLQKNLGSGEGIIDAYVKPADKESGEPRGLHESIVFVADEIDSMQALGTRSGSTLMGTLRSGFSGTTLGFSNRNASSLHLEAHGYRMTLVVHVQPAKAAALIDDSHGGMLQRVMWFPGEDNRITTETPPMPAALTLPPFTAWQYPQELKIPYETVELIRDERVRAMRGDQDHLDGHALFVREKFAFALALLDGRDEMTLEDWRLAGIASRVSDHTRTWVTEQLAKARNDEVAERGTVLAAVNVSKGRAEWERNDRIDNWIKTKVKAAGTQGITKGALTRAAHSPDRQSIGHRVDMLADNGVVKQIERKRWVLGDD